jgi:hypothetical protein
LLIRLMAYPRPDDDGKHSKGGGRHHGIHGAASTAGNIAAMSRHNPFPVFCLIALLAEGPVTSPVLAEDPVETPPVTVRSDSTAAFQRRAAEMQRGIYRPTLSRASAAVARAEAGQCPELARQRAPRYREILASALGEAGKADAMAAEHPARAAALYRRAERIAGGVVAGASAIGCEAEG